MKNHMFWVILEEISDYFFEYGQQAVLFAILLWWIAGILYIFWVKTKRQKIEHGLLFAIRAVCLFLFFFYIYMVFAITFLSRAESYTNVMNVQIFSTFQNTFHHKKYILENMVMFVPYAVFLFILLPPCRKIYRSVLVGVCTSLCIEVSQYVTHLGRFEVDDLLTNMVGMLIGYAMCKVISFFCFEG